MNIEVCRI